MTINTEKLEHHMARQCINPKDLSLRAGISYPAFKRAANGGNSKIATIGLIAKALNVDVLEIIETEQKGS